jgi:hypothetical protein
VCGLYRGMALHTGAQAKSIRNSRGCSSGGRDVCKACWMNGPTESDLMVLDDYLTFWRLDIDTRRTDRRQLREIVEPLGGNLVSAVQ